MALLTVPSCANAEDLERLHLSLMLRQLDALDRQSRQRASQPKTQPSRYHFDYERFQSDLERIRFGVQDYLTPRRAQPRDPFALSGDYRKESGNSP
ncbi:integrative conjugative element protein, RAQPRD family [Pseudomonas huaxiensis]|uniref:integrative conjugative element protein, RAQPRD family n=1 Tax=Pseudomonas huaxiensis TaxID=2213017 RepID=UPI0021F0741A|nr:RAQPRD family integrative conjugative element protein [Pseudomonas huaxiensis]